MWSDRSFRVEQRGVFQELYILVVARHQGRRLRLPNLRLYLLLLRLAQSGYVAPVNPSRVAALELRQQPGVLVIRSDVHFAQNALWLLLLVRILHLEIGEIICRRTSGR